jgi:hypothetical protein
VELESRWKDIARRHGDYATSLSADWELEWASLWQQVLQTRRFTGTTIGTDWNVEIAALWKRVERKRQAHGSSSSAGDTPSATSSGGGDMNRKHGGDSWDPWEWAKARGFHGRGISTREEWDAELSSLCSGDVHFAFSPEWNSLWERVAETRRCGGTPDWPTEWETIQERLARARARRNASGLGSRHRQGQHSSHGHGGTSSSSTASNQQGARSRPPPRVPRPIGARLTVCW